MKIEFKVRPVTRYVVTKYENDCEGRASSGCLGEYDNGEIAYQVAYALARESHQRLGYPLEDERIQYPEHPINDTEQLKGFGLSCLSTTYLKSLWDGWDGISPEGEEVHAELNKRGEGNYCAV